MTRNFHLSSVFILCVLICFSCKSETVNQADSPDPSIETAQIEVAESTQTIDAVKETASRFEAPEGWVEFTDDTPGFVTDIRYATTNNFVEAIMYPCGKCFLRNTTAKALKAVAAELEKKNLGIKLFDCYRPGPVQQRLWDKVPNASYVTPPWKGSQHNRGAAVDLTIVDATGQQLDMGTAFDYFGEEAHHTYTQHSATIQNNRILLKTLMEHFGFSSIRTEWWHYSIKDLQSLDVSQWEWECD